MLKDSILGRAYGLWLQSVTLTLLRRLWQGFHTAAIHEEFGTAVQVQGTIWQSEAAAFAAAVTDLSKGGCTVRLDSRNT